MILSAKILLAKAKTKLGKGEPTSKSIFCIGAKKLLNEVA